MVQVNFPEKTVLKKLEIEGSGMTQISIDDMEVSDHLSVDISGASFLDIAGSKFGNVEIGVSGASNVKFSGDAASLDLTASGASHIWLSGHAGLLAASASGASRILAEKFKADKTSVHFSGASSININD